MLKIAGANPSSVALRRVDAEDHLGLAGKSRVVLGHRPGVAQLQRQAFPHTLHE